MTLTKKTSGVCGLIKKTDYNPKISDIEKNILLRLIIVNLQMIYLMQS